MANTFGTLFRITTFGESHGGAVGVVIDGCPANYLIDLKKVQSFLDRRRPGQSALTSPRQELDQVECLSGLYDSQTLGTPITLMVRNKDAQPSHYDDLKKTFRPSHADYTTYLKFQTPYVSGGVELVLARPLVELLERRWPSKYLPRCLQIFQS